MKRVVVFLAAVATVLGVMVAGCTQAAPAPSAIPAAPTKAAAPAAPAATTAPAAAAPTTAPAKKVDFPASGKTITFLVGYSTGGANDVMARMLAPFLEKELGVPVAVVNRPGGGTQVAMTELAKAKPDGYTIGMVDLPAINLTYLLPDRQAAYTRKDFLPLHVLNFNQPGWIVEANSPFKSVKDVIDAAKAKPESVKVGDTGFQLTWHLSTAMAEKVTGANFAEVHFDGGGALNTAVLGGHIDVGVSSPFNASAMLKSGQVRMLGVMGQERDKFFPDIPTFREQGYDVAFQPLYPMSVPAGTPKEVADVWATALQKATADPEFKKKADGVGATLAPPMTPAEIEKRWDDMDSMLKPLLELIKQK